MTATPVPPGSQQPGPGEPTPEELAAVLAALRIRAVVTDASRPREPADSSPLAAWRRRRLEVLGQAPRRFPRS